jgi:arsenate reductase-like glutaredoxin family protein
LRDQNVPFHERDYSREPFTLEELDALIGDRPIGPYLNPRHSLYQERNWAENPPPRDEALRLMVEDPNLIMRPLVRQGGRLLARPDEETLAEMARRAMGSTVER